MKFKKSKIDLLQELRVLVTENMAAADLNPEEDVSEFMEEITNKRRARRLKLIRKELDNLIEEMVIKQDLQERERKYNEDKCKKSEEIAHEDFNGN